MRTPDQIRERIAVTWRRQWMDWLGGGGDWPKVFLLDAPTERAAQQRWPEFVDWENGWAAAPLGGTVLTTRRSWPTMGSHDVPTHVSFASAREVAAAIGADTLELFNVAEQRWSDRRAAWPDLAEALRGQAEWMVRLSEVDYDRFIAVVDWITANPDSGLYLRQLPIGGLDTKWIERHAGPIARLLGQRLGRSGSISQVAGLAVDTPARRLRLLDPALRAMVGGLSDITVRLGELASLQLPIRLALVVENQQSALACQDLPGAVVLMGGGFSVTELGRVPWLERIPLLYWGDIDTAGLAILSALRRYHPQTVSCLMDEATLLAHQGLWSEEDTQVRSACNGLSEQEKQLREKLLSGFWRPKVRLEQERIPWRTAWAEVERAAALANAQSLVGETQQVSLPPHGFEMD